MINIDFNREERTGCPEVVYCEHKSVKQIIEIINSFVDKKKSVLGTRLSPEKAKKIKAKFKKIFYDSVGEYFVAGQKQKKPKSSGNSKKGNVLIIKLYSLSCEKF